MVESRRPLSELAGGMQHYPQVLVNIRVQERRDVTQVPQVASAIADVESTLGDQGVR